MKAIAKALVKTVYYTAKFAGHVGAVVKEGAVDGYKSALTEIKEEECPWKEQPEVMTTETADPAVETPY